MTKFRMKTVLTMIVSIAIMTSCGATAEYSEPALTNSSAETTVSVETTQVMTTTTTTTTTTLKPTTTTTTTAPKEPRAYRIGERDVSYDSTNKQHRVFWAFQDGDMNYVSSAATISIIIVNDNGEEVYNKDTHVTKKDYADYSNKFRDTSRLLGCIYIDDSEITPGKVENGSLSISAITDIGDEFPSKTLGIDNLPVVATKIHFPESPIEVNEYGYNGEIQYTFIISDFKLDEESSMGRIDCKVKMTYNYKGKSSSDYCHVSYKIKDTDGEIVTSDEALFGPLAVGDVMKEHFYANDIDKSNEYFIEFFTK